MERQNQLVDVVVDIVCPEVFVCLLLRHDHHFVALNELVSDFDRETEVKVKKASLANIFELRAGLADLSFLVSKLLARVAVWFPAKHGERSLANFALSGKLTLRHAHVGVVTETSVTQDREV